MSRTPRTPGDVLTEKQQIVVDAILTLGDKLGYPPTLRQIADHIGARPENVRGQLILIRKKGMVTWNDGESRTLRVLGADEVTPPEKRCPSCGAPITLS